MRISELPEAKEILIELGERYGDLKNLEMGWRHVVGGKDAFLASLARRAKYEFLLWRIMAKNHVGFFPKKIAYNGSNIGWDTPYRVIKTVPDGEVQITPKTKIIVNLIMLEN
jgi:hypothetical protein